VSAYDDADHEADKQQRRRDEHQGHDRIARDVQHFRPGHDQGSAIRDQGLGIRHQVIGSFFRYLTSDA
jgi:hypothetical protein